MVIMIGEIVKPTFKAEVRIPTASPI